MAERCIKGDFIGFTFGGVHSSELGLMRVSNGSRYEQDLLPPLQDKTVQVSGRDGAIYFNSQYGIRSIKVPVAFDNMDEKSFQRLQQLLMDKKPKYLWFDEVPYKQWLVKSASAQNFKWVCFDESENLDRIEDGDSKNIKKRIYKGEGTLEFNCFSSYAESRINFLDQSVDQIMFLDNHRIKIINFDENVFKEQIFFKITNKDDKDLPAGGSMAYFPFQYNKLCLDENQLNLRDNNVLTNYAKAGYDVISKMEFLSDSGSDVSLFQISYYDPSSWRGYSSYLYLKVFVVIAETDENLVEQKISFGQKYKGYSLSDFKDVSIEIPVNGASNPNFHPIVNGERQDSSLILVETKNKNLYRLWKNDAGELEINKERKLMLITNLPLSLQDNYNYEEWKNSSKLRYYGQDGQNYNTFFPTPQTKEDITTYNYEAKIYNAGDKSSDLYIIWKKDAILEPEERIVVKPITFTFYRWEIIKKTYINGEKIETKRMEEVGKMGIKQFNLQANDTGLIFDSKLKMIKGIDSSGKVTGNVYNKYHKSGDFFKLPPCDDNECYSVQIETEDTDDQSAKYSIEYKHYYI